MPRPSLRPERRLHWGRSRNSLLLIAGKHTHIFLWYPKLGADSYGMVLRHRIGIRWRHWRVVFLQRNGRRSNSHQRAGKYRARPTLTVFEVSRWVTVGTTQDRTDLKAYVRLKTSLGGKQIA